MSCQNDYEIDNGYFDGKEYSGNKGCSEDGEHSGNRGCSDRIIVEKNCCDGPYFDVKPVERECVCTCVRRIKIREPRMKRIICTSFGGCGCGCGCGNCGR